MVLLAFPFCIFILRTGVVGVLLLMIYMGGATCAHLLSHQPLVAVVAF
jgi:hypothetical protein